VRPLIGLRRAEVRRLAEQAGLRWREDSSNLDPSFARNRVRDLLLPRMAEIGGEAAVEELRRFAEVVERLERDLAARTAELCWRPLAARHATRRHDDGALGGVLRRAALSRLPAALRRRALWRLVVEGTTRAPGRRLLALLERDIEHEKCARHTLPGGWSLVLRKESMELHPPAEFLALAPRQPWLPFPERAPRAERPRSAAWVARTQSPREAVVLPVPGSVTLTDGRRIVCEVTSGPADRPVPRDPKVVELDASALPSHLLVRAPVEGDRFHPLGAPGSRPLRRFLADARVPRGERRLVPLVLDGERIVWVAGLRVAQASRVVATSRVRLRLELHGGPRGASDAPDASTAASAGPASRQLELPFERGAPGSAG
jgi:tRNA(Ile)-lysidine synthase